MGLEHEEGRPILVVLHRSSCHSEHNQSAAMVSLIGGFNVEEGEVRCAGDALPILEWFRGMNLASKTRDNKRSFRALSLMSPAEIELDTKIRTLSAADAAAWIEKRVPSSGWAELPEGLSTQEGWGNLSFAHCTKDGSRIVAVCVGLLAKLCAGHATHRTTAVAWLELKDRGPRFPRQVARISTWTLRAILGLNGVAGSPQWKKELLIAWPFPNEEGRLVRALNVSVYPALSARRALTSRVLLQKAALRFNLLEPFLRQVVEDLGKEIGSKRGG